MTIEQLKEKMPWITADEWVQHPNGGGWKHKTARVPDDVKLPFDYMKGSRHPVTANSESAEVQIGCHRYDIAYWLKHYKAIGRKESYTAEQVAEYGLLLNTVKAWLAAFGKASA